MTVEEIQEIVSKEITGLNWSMSPEELYKPIEYILSLGGKRIRPVLTLMACKMFGGEVNKVIPVALALEVFHNFTLLHDDLMDNADVRRGKPTVHKKWSENTAILSGDVMLIKAYQFLSQIEDAVRFKQSFDLFSVTATEVCEGQQYDMEFEERLDVTEEEYLEMIRLKTAVLIATSLKMGALLGGASEKNADLLYEFGIHIGIAFQLKDDWLDVYGDEKVFGKKIGGDILENKKTYLLITALEDLQGIEKENLLTWIKTTDFEENEKIKAVTDLYNQAEIKEKTKDKMQEYVEKSLIVLKKVELPDESKRNLIILAKSLIERDL